MSDSEAVLQRLIKEASAEGMHDSQGVFTVAGDRARFKLGEAQLPRPEAWILKVLQAAVVLGAPEFRVQQQRRRTIIRFPVTEETPLEEVLRVLQDPTVTVGRAFGHLAVGLRALAIANRSFRLYFFDERGLHGLFRGAWGEMVHSRASRTAGKTVRLELVVDFPIGEMGRTLLWLSSGTQMAVREAQQLDGYAHCSPIPVLLDGRDVATLEPFVHRRGLSLKSFPILLEGLLPLGPSGGSESFSEGLSIPQTLASKAQRLDPKAGTVRAYSASVKEVRRGRYRALCQLSFHVRKPTEGSSSEPVRRVEARSWCHWILDGVVLSSEPLPLEPGAATIDLFVDASGLPLDLTTFGLVDGEAKKERLDLSFEEIRQISQSWELKDRGLRIFYRGVFRHSAGALAVGGAMLLNPSTALLGGGLAIYSVAAYLSGSRTSDSVSPEQIRAALDELAGELSRCSVPEAPPSSEKGGPEANGPG